MAWEVAEEFGWTKTYDRTGSPSCTKPGEVAAERARRPSQRLEGDSLLNL